MSKDKLTLTEALKLLEAYELSDELHESTTNSIEDAYSHDYDEYINSTSEQIKSRIIKAGSIDNYKKEENKLNEIASDSNKEPAIGDIAVLKIKLNNTKENKFVYDGYEKRPVLIVKVNSKDSVDIVEITHSKTFKNIELRNIGKLGNDTRDSYINIYDYQSNIETNYEFPLKFKDNKPMTIGECSLEYFGKIYKGKDKDEPFIARFNYKDNYKEKIDIDTLITILSELKTIKNKR